MAQTFRRLMDLRGDNLIETALAALIDSGDIDRHLKKTTKLFRERRDIFCDLLTEALDGVCTFKKPDGGMAVWARFPKRFSIPKLSEKAAGLGLLIGDGSSYRTPGSTDNGLRLGFASLTPAEIKEAIHLLEKAAKG